MSARSKYNPELAWDYWYHCMGNTYGTWLPGDPRGFRTRYHRQHIEGDYKNPPPPDAHESHRRISGRNLGHTVVKLNTEARSVACRQFCESLMAHEIQIAEFAIDAVHFHLLARFEPALIPSADPGTPEVPGLRGNETKKRASAEDDPPRHFVGLAKSSATHALKSKGFVRPGPVWGVRWKIIPIEDERHFEYLRSTYLPNHRKNRAALWSDLRSED